MIAKAMVAGVKQRTRDWKYDVISVGYPADGGDDLRLVCGPRHGDDMNMVFPARVKSMVWFLFWCGLDLPHALAINTD